MNQDPMGIQGRLITSYKWVDQDNHVVAGKNRLYSHVTTGTDRVYSRPLMNGDVAVALLNTNSFSSPRNITFSFREVRGTYLQVSPSQFVSISSCCTGGS